MVRSSLGFYSDINTFEFEPKASGKVSESIFTSLKVYAESLNVGSAKD